MKQNPAKAKVTRKFLVAEGIYYNSGDLAPLPRLVSPLSCLECKLMKPILCQVEFRNKYKIPLFLEESLSLGVLGRTGKGAAEHFNISVL